MFGRLRRKSKTTSAPQEQPPTESEGAVDPIPDRIVISLGDEPVVEVDRVLEALAALPPGLSATRVHLDATRTLFVGARIANAAVEEVCQRRGGTLVVVGVDDAAAARFSSLAFRAGVATQVIVADPTSTASVVRRVVQRELLAANPSPPDPR